MCIRDRQKVVDLAKLVSKYSGPIHLHIVNFTDIQLYIYDQCPHEELTIIMRRYMMRIAERLAADAGAQALILSLIHILTHQRMLLESQGIKSVLQCRIMDQGKPRGFIGFE